MGCELGGATGWNTVLAQVPADSGIRVAVLMVSAIRVISIQHVAFMNAGQVFIPTFVGSDDARIVLFIVPEAMVEWVASVFQEGLYDR